MRWRKIGEKPFRSLKISHEYAKSLVEDSLGRGILINPGVWPYAKRVDRMDLRWDREDNQWTVVYYEQVKEEDSDNREDK